MIRNTSKSPNPEWLFGRNPGAIEEQEAQGQRELAASDQLPVRAVIGGDAAPLYAKLGIEVIGPTEGDELFLDVKLPKNMEIVPTDHTMWSSLQRDGKEVGSIFYKAAFYDRGAHFSIRDDA